ncbi:hypothetical protein [Microbacterium sp. 13-71-7]|jgi:hypothetical protein|uniref:hypothetical protein n=1 Tax=Microbacterium sp. 13-71-7 TaxID=1970399 RepID=UPI0025FB7C6C|nr:hypothetical protein [Microbacterium sp. 13-71-7]
MQKIRLALAGSAAALAIVAMLGAPAFASDAPTIGDLDQLSTIELEVLRSDAPKKIQVDPNSGDITSVQSLTDSEMSGLLRAAGGGISSRTLTSVGTWYGRPPALNYDFNLGVTSGTWPNRGNFYTGPYYAKLCWNNGLGTFCMPERNGANAWIELGSSVTGRSVDLSTTR